MSLIAADVVYGRTLLTVHVYVIMAHNNNNDLNNPIQQFLVNNITAHYHGNWINKQVSAKSDTFTYMSRYCFNRLDLITSKFDALNMRHMRRIGLYMHEQNCSGHLLRLLLKPSPSTWRRRMPTR